MLLLSHFSCVQLCATPSLGFSRQEPWSGLPFPSPMHKSEKWKWSRSVMSNSSPPHGLQPARLLHPWDFPGKSTGVGCHCLLREERHKNGEKHGFLLMKIKIELETWKTSLDQGWILWIAEENSWKRLWEQRSEVTYDCWDWELIFERGSSEHRMGGGWKGKPRLSWAFLNL